MEIEKELRQNVKFSSEYQKLTVNILFTASWLGVILARKLKPFGLTIQQYNILRILRGQHPNPATINMLIERMFDKSSNASRLVERLLKKTFVERYLNASDKRSVHVKITEKGLLLLQQIDDQFKNFDLELQNITKEEAREMSRLLDKLRG